MLLLLTLIGAGFAYIVSLVKKQNGEKDKDPAIDPTLKNKEGKKK